MQQELLALPTVFTLVPDPRAKDQTVKLSCQVSGRRLVMNAVAADNSAFSKEFSEQDLAAIKGDSPWVGFFKDIEKSFHTGKEIKLAPEGPNMVVTFKNGKAFLLPKSQAKDGGMQLLGQIWKYYEALHAKNADAELTELKGKEHELQKRLAEFEDEKRQVKEHTASMESEEAKHTEKSAALAAELQALEAKLRAEGQDPELVIAEAPVEADLTTCVGRIPLGTKNTRQYDTGLLKLIKSKFTPLKDDEAEEGDEEPKYMKVIRPYTQNEFAAQMKSLPEGERQKVLTVMEKIDEWDYNVWTIQDFTDKGALFHTAYALFVRHDFLRKFNLDEEILINFLSQVEGGYHPNPYHNSMHGADVLHIVHYIMTPGRLKETAKLEDQDHLASLIAGMIHDYDHPGLNNNFHIKVQSYLSILYNDRSILENHHCAEVFDLMKLPRFNILAGLSEDERNDIRETIIEMVLSTDMGLHAKIFGNWKRRIQQDRNLHLKKEDQRLALAMTIKMADISNCGRPEHLYLKWAAKLSEEFFLQGDNERNRSDPVSPFMDRFAPSMAKSQIAFMNYIVIPMFESIAEYLPDMHFSVDHCESNKNYWQSNDDSI
eukprot:TRINITY_DN2258_c0_g1_i1.p1 TRINITY_DN2258_c0_g1~~TRINITY_DN2258_c0_g1_i1.p1  ORF type:complete len:601 (-),score=150.17 TRINITY_DN2258_c0_g1_i1:808-2610(-)